MYQQKSSCSRENLKTEELMLKIKHCVNGVMGPLQHSTLWLLICLPSFSPRYRSPAFCENEILAPRYSLMNLHFQTRSQKSLRLVLTYPKIESNRMSQLHSYQNHWPTYRLGLYIQYLVRIEFHIECRRGLLPTGNSLIMLVDTFWKKLYV